MNHASLFSGIGGFDLAAEWMGWNNVFHCEINPFCQKVLKHHFPNSECYADIKKTDFTIWRGRVDILTGGFPCQPYSLAGKRLGKEDERHLWPEMLRAIREIRPRWIVGENVFGIVNWNGGLVFDEVQTDLEAEGYEVQPYVLPACAVNAPHRRDRVWFVAYAVNRGYKTGRKQETKANGIPSISRAEMVARKSNGASISQNATNPNRNGLNQCDCNDEINASERGFDALGNIDKSDDYGNAADTQHIRLKHSKQQEQSRCKERIFEGVCINGDASDTDLQRYDKFKFTAITNKPERFNSQKNIIGEPGGWQNFPTQSPICGGDDGIPIELDGITFSKWRNESIKAYGNAVVPQVVLQIFKAIEAYEQ